MTWFDVDGARAYLAHGGGKMPSRKVLYNMVAAGMRVARLGDSGRRMLFAAEWIDAHLQRTAERDRREPSSFPQSRGAA